MKLFVLTLISVALAAASDKPQDGETDESGRGYGIYEPGHRPVLEHQYTPERRHPVVEHVHEPRFPVLEHVHEPRLPIVEHAHEPRLPLVEYVPEGPKVVENVLLNHRPLDYGREVYRNHHYAGHHGHGRYPNHFRKFGREGLGLSRRTAYASGLRFPLTPKLLEVLYKPHHEGRRAPVA